MSLITRCPACRTMFRVVPDQLKVSEGWVRCGKCEEIFDASAHLQDLQGAPDPMEPAAHHGRDEGSPWVAEYPSEAEAVAAPGDAAPDPLGIDSGFPVQESAFPPTESGGGHPDFDELPVPGRLEPSLSHPDEEPAGASVGPVGASLAASADRSASTATVVQGADLSFVREARRRARWRRWPVRLALSLIALCLVGLLAVQILWQERDRLAAFHPSLRPVLEEACGLMGCEVQPLRQIDAVVIDGSAFTKMRGDLFRLSMTLRNNGPVPVAAPAVELALTDALDQPVVQRVLQPTELGARKGVIGARGELQSTLVLAIKSSVPADRIAGYRLLAFYP